jgi:hypothetical protein
LLKSLFFVAILRGQVQKPRFFLPSDACSGEIARISRENGPSAVRRGGGRARLAALLGT